MHTPTPRMLIHRAPRKWPHIPAEPMTIQTVQAPTKPSNTTILVTVASMAGLLVAGLVYSQSGGSSSKLMLGFLAVSGLSMVASVIAFIAQRQTASAEARDLVKRYSGYLSGLEQSISAFSVEEHEARSTNDLSVLDMFNILARHPERAWQRHPDDPDFLAVRVGVGDAPAWLKVELADHAAPFASLARDVAIRELQQRARQIADHFQVAHDVPLTVPLREHGAVALINGAPGVARASDLARSMVAQVAIHHPPNEVQIVVFAPQRATEQWRWVAELPTAGRKWQGLATEADAQQQRLSILLEELNRRQQAQRDRGATQQRVNVPLPHLLVVVDSFGDSSEADPLMTPALALALQQGKLLGATVISVHSARQQAPSQVTLAVDVTHSRIVPLSPNPPATTACTTVDGLDRGQGMSLAQVLKPLQLEAQASLDLPDKVRLLPLLDPPINRAEDYPIVEVWKQTSQRHNASGDNHSFVIPLGSKIGQEPILLDFVNDGPHGLLIGQTGSGKSELLRSVIAALAVQYPPDKVNFVLVDYKGGLAFDVFGQLPHTVAYLTNMVSAGQTNRFLAMLEAEIMQRQAARASQKAMPELFVIIDEFAEMVSRRSSGDTSDAVLDNLLSIARLGRELGVHLLFAAQRPEGSIIQRLRGYVQYRICLRTNTPEDSRDIINVPDASQLPFEIPGRGYLLRGDNELSLFQAARIHVPSFQSAGILHRSSTGLGLTRSEYETTADAIIAQRMRQLTGTPVATRWPVPLPTPTLQSPTPLALFAGAAPPRGTLAWMNGKQPSLRPMEVPLGLYDRPAEQRQEWFVADLAGPVGSLHGGPLLVMGDLNAGKTTTLQTLLLYLGSMRSPNELRWYILSPNSSLVHFSALPHTADSTGTRNVIDGLDEAEFREFKGRFERAAQTEASKRPALLLVIDDYDELAPLYKQDLFNLTAQAARRRDQAVYLVVSAARPAYSNDGLSPTLMNLMATRVILYMNDRDQLRNLIRTPKMIDAIPGRGLVQTRRALDDIQIAVPVAGKDEIQRMENLEDGVRQIAKQWG